MKKITVSILTTLLMLSMVFSSSVFAANEEKASAWDSFLGLFSAKTAATSDVGVEYRGHVQNKGDFPLDGSWIQGPDQLGTVGESLRLEAFWIKLTNEVPAGLHIQYRVHVQNKGWMAPVEDGALAGTQGEGLQIESVEIKLVDDAGNPAVGYSVEYRGHIQNKGDMPADGSWYKDGEQLGTVGEFLRLEALEVKIVQTKADMTAYNAAVAAAGALTEADYTADSWAALETALATVVTEDNTQAEVDAATAAINDAIDALVMVTRIDTAVATGKDKITVTFNQAVVATDTLSVKKGSVVVNLDAITYAEDNMSAIIDTTSNLTEGNYTVTLVSGDATSSVTFAAVNEKVASIVVTSETAPLNPAGVTITSAYNANCTIFVNYKVLNQYGERMTGQTINWTPSTGGEVGVSTAPTSSADGTLVIGNATTSTVFIPGATVYLTGVYPTTGAVVNASFVVGLESKADTAVFKGIYDNVNAVMIDTLPAGFVDGRYELLYEVMDQYGNKIASPTVSQLTMTSSYPLFVVAPSTTAGTTTQTVNSVLYQGVALVRGTYADKGGTTTIQAISNLTGKTTTFDITSEAKAAVKTLTLSAPTTIVAEGETAVIPFEAYDQFGNAVTKYSDLNGKVTFSSNIVLGQYADGTAKLTFTAPSTGATSTADLPVYLTSLVTDGGNFSSLMVSVKETAVPTTVAGVDTADTTRNVTTTIAQGASQDLYATDLMIQDQYGRTLTDAQVNTWMNTTANSAIILDSSTTASSPFTVASTASGADAARHTIAASTDKFTVTGKTATTGLSSTESLVFSLSTAVTPAPLSGSSKSVTFTLGTQSAYTSYEVADLGTMYNDGLPGTQTSTSYDKTLKVYGVKASGEKVLLPSTQYTATTTGKLNISGAGVISDKAASGYDATEFQTSTLDTAYSKVLDVPVTVNVKDSSGAAAAVVNATLKVSHAAAKVASTEFLSSQVTDGSSFVEAGSVSATRLNAVFDTTKTKDQYGVVISENPSITISNLVKVTGSTFAVTSNGTSSVSIANATAGDTFKATYTYASGYAVSVNFTVTSNDVTAPTITAVALSSDNSTNTLAKAGDTVTYDVTVSEAATATVQIASSANNIAGAVTTDLTTASGTAKTITFTVQSGDDGAVTLATGLYVLTDAAGNTTTYTAGQLNTLATGSVTADTTAPTFVSATADSATAATVTFSENVAITTPVAGLFAANVANTADSAAPSVSGTDVILTFPAATFTTGTGSVLDYTASGTAANNVTDLAGNPVVSFTDQTITSNF
ncbi:hypothetical protein [Acetobacterium wieringae]|uniref:hypothetical protein n=1 Tax=Acetobacterium wieringae TaxID=52694 RepID=UPI0026F119F6|nr:hypothetical protein [Acetobacterium wieringae]